MEIGFIGEYVVLLVLGICLCVGYIIKHFVPGERVNRLIPLFLGVLGIVLNCWINGWQLTPEVLLGGMFSGLASTGLHQAFTNLIAKEK